jgi:hypothetical protein
MYPGHKRIDAGVIQHEVVYGRLIDLYFPQAEVTHINIMHMRDHHASGLSDHFVTGESVDVSFPCVVQHDDLTNERSFNHKVLRRHTLHRLQPVPDA